MTQRRGVTTASPYEEMFGFCRAMRVGNLIYIAGTAPIGPDGKTVGAGDPAAQARRCFDIVKEALGKLGSGLEDVVRTRMYLTRIEDWEIVGKVHGEYFKDVRPTATLVQVVKLIDPEWLIEVEADAVVAGSSGNKQ
jgi:enamine deaminase RidA (YjgF/YER057c/UK114 family)